MDENQMNITNQRNSIDKGEENMTYKLIHGDCFEEMGKLESGSFDLILTDPPYGIMKGCPLDPWEKRGEKAEWDEALDTETIFQSCLRLLRQNGRLILFSQEPLTSELITKQNASLPFSYKAIWLKKTSGNSLMAKSAMVSSYEEILIFKKLCPNHDYNHDDPLRGYAKAIKSFIGPMTRDRLNKAIGNQGAVHFLMDTGIEFKLCSQKTYQRIEEAFHIEKMIGFLDFKTLEKMEIEYRELLKKKKDSINPSIFNLWEGKDSKSNVLYYPKDSDGSHPTQKPVMLLEDLIKTFSNEGDRILDFTMGSGSTGVACRNCGRDFVGIEKDEGYFKIAQDRLNGIDLKGQTSIFTDFSLLEDKK